jgi:phospholipid/cholesterol/gamma-HCH transport system substrate-binding protein
MSERGQKIRLGLFVFLALASLATLVVLFGKTQNYFFKDRLDYKAEFSNAPGIQKGTPVKRSGVSIGEVDTVTLEESGKVLVVLRIDPKFKPRQNEVPAITQALLTGDSIVELIPNPDKRTEPLGPTVDPDPKKPLDGRSPLTPRDVGQRAEPLLDVSQKALVEMEKAFKEFSKVAPEMRDALRESSATLQTIREAVPELKKTNDGLQGLIGAARITLPKLEQTNDHAQKALIEWGNVGEQARLLIASNQEKVGKTIDKMNVSLDSATKSFERVNQLLSDENIKNMNATLANVKKGSDKIPQLAADSDQLMKDASAGVKRLKETAEKIDAAAENAAVTLENIRKTTQNIADRSEPILKNVQEGSEQFKLLVSDSRVLLGQFARSDGTVAKLFNDPSLYNNVNDSVLMLTRMAPRLELILSNLETFSDKIARHPEGLGVRGLVKPDSGLKNSIHAPLPSNNAWGQPKY